MFCIKVWTSFLKNLLLKGCQALRFTSEQKKKEISGLNIMCWFVTRNSLICKESFHTWSYENYGNPMNRSQAAQVNQSNLGAFFVKSHTCQSWSLYQKKTPVCVLAAWLLIRSLFFVQSKKHSIEDWGVNITTIEHFTLNISTDVRKKAKWSGSNRSNRRRFFSELPFDSFSKLDNYPFTQLLIYLHLKHNFQECFSFSAIDPFDLRAQKTDLPLLSF